MPLWPSPFCRDPLVYPAGFSPGFDSSHPAAKNIVFSVTSARGNCINLLSGRPGTTTIIGGGSIAAQILGLGPVTHFNSAYTTFALTPLTGTSIVCAVILRFFSLAGAFQPVLGNNSINRQTGQNLSFFQNNLELNYRLSTDFSFTFTPVVNVPYFVACSANLAAGTATVNNVIVNLLTGQTFSKTQSAAATLGTPAGNYVIGNDGATANVTVDIAAAMWADGNFLSLQALRAWASDPWSFWYPNPQYSIVGAAAAPTTQFTSFTNPGAHMTRRIETVGY